MPNVAQHNYNVGWNEIAYGVIHWTEGSKWDSPLAWVSNMREIAKKQRNVNHYNSVPYFDGIIAACETYQQTGSISMV